ncbi:MAG: hypothetical protein ABIQ88_15910 [Chitinophagaceae bacterium]
MPVYIKSFAAAIAAMLFLNAALAQHYHKGDYIVTTNRDTVHGILQKGFFGGAVKLRKADSVLVYSSNEIEAYYSGEKNALYKRRKLPGSLMQFVECAERGKINVFIQHTSSGSYSPGAGGAAGMYGSYPGADNIFLEKEEGALVQVVKVRSFKKTKFEKELFLSLVEDIPGIKEMFLENEKHDAADICYYIHEYNLKAAGGKN